MESGPCFAALIDHCPAQGETSKLLRPTNFNIVHCLNYQELRLFVNRLPKPFFKKKKTVVSRIFIFDVLEK